MSQPFTSQDGSWTRDDQTRLREARRRRGHTQTQCADELRRLGADRASQATVSEWEQGQTKRPSTLALRALKEYIAGTAPDDDEAMPDAGPDRAPLPVLDPDRASAWDRYDSRADLNQREKFMAAVNARFASGHPMSDADERFAIRWGAALGMHMDDL